MGEDRHIFSLKVGGRPWAWVWASLQHLPLQAVATVARGATTDCLPDCTGCTPGDKVPNKKNCHQYYTCREGCIPSDVVFDCPSGQKFDTTSKDCKVDDASDPVTCGLCEPRCKYECVTGATFVAKREDCNKYYFCGVIPPVEIHCEDDKPNFNGDKCVADPSQCCEKCLVYCWKANTETADPASCKHFYYCFEQGFPLPEDRYECPEGENFDAEASTCLPEADTTCYQPCAETS